MGHSIIEFLSTTLASAVRPASEMEHTSLTATMRATE